MVSYFLQDTKPKIKITNTNSFIIVFDYKYIKKIGIIKE